MTRHQLTKENTDGILHQLAQTNPTLIYLFGSSARGEASSRSDVDIAYLSENILSGFDNFELAGNISHVLGREVDLVPLHNASIVFRQQVIRNGIVLFEKNATTRHRFEMYTLSDYVRLNEERMPVLERIQKEGWIYGH